MKDLKWITHVVSYKWLLQIYNHHKQKCKLCQNTTANTVENRLEDEINQKKAHLIENIISLEVALDSDDKWYQKLKDEIEVLTQLYNKIRLQDEQQDENLRGKD